MINIGSGVEKSIKEYAEYIMNHLNVRMKISYVKKNLNGTPRKLLDSSLAKKYGWKHKTSLKKGLSLTIEDYIKRYNITLKP